MYRHKHTLDIDWKQNSLIVHRQRTHHYPFLCMTGRLIIKNDNTWRIMRDRLKKRQTEGLCYRYNSCDPVRWQFVGDREHWVSTVMCHLHPPLTIDSSVSVIHWIACSISHYCRPYCVWGDSLLNYVCECVCVTEMNVFTVPLMCYYCLISSIWMLLLKTVFVFFHLCYVSYVMLCWCHYIVCWILFL